MLSAAVVMFDKSNGEEETLPPIMYVAHNLESELTHGLLLLVSCSTLFLDQVLLFFLINYGVSWVILI